MFGLLQRVPRSANRARSFTAATRRNLPFAPTLIRQSDASTTESAPPAAELTPGEQLLFNKLTAELQGAKIDVQDVSGGCGSFYAISISHSSFKGLSTIKQHRLVNELLKNEIKGMHGLQLKTSPN